MSLKTYAAIMTGAFAMILTVFVLWAATQTALHDALAIGTGAYFIATFGTFAAIECRERRKKKQLAATIVTLVREEWEHGERAS